MRRRRERDATRGVTRLAGGRTIAGSDMRVNISTFVLTCGGGIPRLVLMTTDVTAVGDDPGLVPIDASSRERYREAGVWSGSTLPAELMTAAQTYSERTALVTGDGAWSYGALFDTAGRFARGLLKSAGVRAGDAVMFQMGNVAETVVAYLGCLLAGARPVGTLPQHGTREIGLLAEHVDARCLISQADFGDGRLLDQASELLAQGRLETVVVARGSLAHSGALTYDELLADPSEPGPLPYLDLDPLQIAVFQLSGGTTGLPKVAPRLHEEYAYNSRAWAQALDYGPDTVLLYPLPLMHNAGISLALQPAILSGATLLLSPSADVDVLLGLIDEHRPHVLPLVPPALAIRLLDAERTHRTDLSCIRDFVVGGQRLPVEVAERLRDELGIEVRQMFGMAEGMFLLTPADADEQVRHLTVGQPISVHDEVRVLEPDGEHEVPDGAVGELAARGPYTIRGYYRASQHNSAAFTRDGFYRTGDLSRRHRFGEATFYSIDGRIKDVINRGAEKIHAEEVEELIVRHPHVATAALVSMPDRILGERACAYLVMEQGRSPLTVTALGKHLLGCGLAKYKIPERVEIVPALPLSNIGKVAKKDLRVDIEHKLDDEAGDRR